MNAATLSTIHPVRGVLDGKGNPDPSVRQAWLDMRASGITATEIRDWGNGSKRREIIAGKITGITADLTHIAAVDHGNRREPIIAEWVRGRFGIEPCSHVYMSGRNSRHLASPDGISLDPFTGELIVGTEDAALLEIKTSKYDMTPGRIDAGYVLVEIDTKSHFATANYYTQIQWQMYVMNATTTLFVHEQHDGTIDPETGTFRPVGPPKFAWIPRDQALIDILVERVAPAALAEVDAARELAKAGDLPPASDLPGEHAILVADLLKARDAEALAVAAKTSAWAKLQEFYLREGSPDVSIDGGFARVTVTTSTSYKEAPDMDAARKRAPKLVAQYEALVKRYTKRTPTTTRRLTVTPAKDIAQ